MKEYRVYSDGTMFVVEASEVVVTGTGVLSFSKRRDEPDEAGWTVYDVVAQFRDWTSWHEKPGYVEGVAP